MKLQKEIALESEYIYQGKILKLRRESVQLQNGKTSVREVVEHAGGVCVLALDEKKRALVVTQYRRPFDAFLVELPAGKIDPGEEPYQAAMRELEEETGYTTDRLHPMGKILASPGFCDEVLYLYYTDHLMVGKCHPDEDEFLNLEHMPWDTLVQKVMQDEIIDGKTVAAVLKAKEKFHL